MNLNKKAAGKVRRHERRRTQFQRCYLLILFLLLLGLIAFGSGTYFAVLARRYPKQAPIIETVAGTLIGSGIMLMGFCAERLLHLASLI